MQGFSLLANCGVFDLVNYSDSQIAVITVGAASCGSGSNSVVSVCTGNQAFVGQLGAYSFPANTRCMVLGGYRDWETDRKSTRLNSSHEIPSRMPSSA